MNVRPATQADTPFLRQLHHRVYREVVLRQFGSWDEAAQDGWFEQGLADAEFSVVELNGEPVGAIGLKHSTDQLYLVELQIAPERQAQGLGSALLRAQLERARLLQKPISLRVLLQNRARSLYERHGFIVTGQTETHYLMEWQLEGSSTPAPPITPRVEESLTLQPIRVRRLGARSPAVLVLHGGPGAPGSARGVARVLAQRFTVFEPLQRRSGSVPLTVEQHVQDLAAVAPAPALVVGHSWGAMLGLSFASRHPAAVSKLVLVGCGTYEEAARAELRSSIQQRLGAERRQRVEELQRLACATSTIQREAALRELGAIHAELETYAPVDDDAEQAELLPVDPEGHAETWNDVIRLQKDDVEPQAFSQIRAPVLMIHGDYDPHPGSATRDLLRKYIPHLEYLNLERCGHEPWRERHARDAFAAALCDWLERN